MPSVGACLDTGHTLSGVEDSRTAYLSTLLAIIINAETYINLKGRAGVVDPVSIYLT